MLKNIVPVKTICSTFPPWKNGIRSFFNIRKIKRAFKRYFDQSGTKPPYFHITQVGDPVLRAPTLPINLEVIQLFQFQMAIKQMKVIMENYDIVGLSACQIGLPWKVFMIQVTEKHLKEIGENLVKIREMEVIPFQVFINPTIRTINHKLVSFPEVCASVRGYSAEVSRAREVELKAINDSSEEVTVRFKGWGARIVQHEMDHLNGILFTDKMDRRTFSCCCWNEVNKHKGFIEIRFDS
ncbi:peptide deformylase, mitochondrial-like [Vespa mandarinia]|uniref:peptide deformylase, mitochondrial-like n=1 Tax=Vespa mandarinia TaxID=7446 RepID=UPI0016133A34|nr:peptide deformylase, mitochondrial-like [Vespa mandarinia]XP_035728308.1 peptide deformylase, mitochondrial-like [Vespa mandarinia]